MLKTILIDDEELAIQRLRRLLQPHTHFINVVAEAMDGEAALKCIAVHQPELVFLDIQMPGMTGFEVVERLESLPWIIFVTAYDQYALKAFETNSVDYLLKPVEPERLLRAVDKLARMQFAPSDRREQEKQQIQRMLAELRAAPARRLQVRIGDRVRFLDLDDIYFFRAADKYVEVHTFDAVYLLQESLSILETRLPDVDFIRIHRSALINLRHLEEAIRSMSGSYRVRMKNQKRTLLPVSRRAKHRLGLG